MAPSRLTRRHLLRLAGSGLGMAAAGAPLAGLLSACTDRSVAPPEVGGGRELRILTWPEYIDADEAGNPGTVSRFEASSGDQVTYDEGWDNTASWDEIVAPNLGAGRPTGFDLLVPTFWVAARLVERGWAAPVPLERVPNHVNIDPAYLTMGWDRGARYHMPWQAGITGIAYNPQLTPPAGVTSIASLLGEPALKGRVGLVDQLRETVALVMLRQGNDPSRPTAAAANAALDELEAAKRSGQIARFTGNEYLDALRSGEFAACLAWSGDVVQLQRERPDIRFVIPAEGGMRWFDTMVIPARAADQVAAARWMNFVYDPANAARITAAVQFISPVLGVRDELARLGGDAASLANNPVLFPDDETRRRLYTWGPMDAATEDELQARFDRLLAS